VPVAHKRVGLGARRRGSSACGEKPQAGTSVVITGQPAAGVLAPRRAILVVSPRAFFVMDAERTRAPPPGLIARAAAAQRGPRAVGIHVEVVARAEFAAGRHRFCRGGGAALVDVFAGGGSRKRRWCSTRPPRAPPPSVGLGGYCSRRWPTHLNPRLSILTAPYDVARNIRQALSTHAL